MGAVYRTLHDKDGLIVNRRQRKVSQCSMTSDRNRLSNSAVVVGIDLNGLGVLRSLGKAGVPTIALDTALNKPEAATRFGRKITIRSLSGPELITDLLKLRSHFK